VKIVLRIKKVGHEVFVIILTKYQNCFTGTFFLSRLRCIGALVYFLIYDVKIVTYWHLRASV